jgi:hypothetical protein
MTALLRRFIDRLRYTTIVVQVIFMCVVYQSASKSLDMSSQWTQLYLHYDSQAAETRTQAERA